MVMRDTLEIYGANDEILANGSYHIKANNNKYQREKIVPLTKAQKRELDSIRRYNERFIIKDSIAELKKFIKKKLADSAKRRDSIFKASLDPNYKSTYNPPIELRSAAPAYKPNIQSGVYTSANVKEEDKSPVKAIEEYFCVQVYTFSSHKPLDIEKYPFLIGYEARLEDGFYRYYIGRTNSSQLAIEVCKSMRSKGILDAIVVKFTDGKRTIYKDQF